MDAGNVSALDYHRVYVPGEFAEINQNTAGYASEKLEMASFLQTVMLFMIIYLHQCIEICSNHCLLDHSAVHDMRQFL